MPAPDGPRAAAECQASGVRLCGEGWPDPSSKAQLAAGDSITIAPAQTLTDKEYQRLRDASIAIIRDMGVECGGSNVQMAVNPDDGQVHSWEARGTSTEGVPGCLLAHSRSTRVASVAEEPAAGRCVHWPCPQQTHMLTMILGPTHEVCR